MRKILILGAAGRDFHVFNTVFRDNEEFQVVAITATQIPYIDNKKYPASLAGTLYPDGIPIVKEEDAVSIIKKEQVDIVVFAYSDVSYRALMNKASEMMAAGASFMFYGPQDTMLVSKKPVISVCAVRTGCGKSQTTRKILDILKKEGKKVVAVRHPMPYGDLEKQRVQRFADYKDLESNKCTIEEREEYEPYTSRGFVVYAGVDYAEILSQAEAEADIILWDGGNNDFSFIKPDLELCVLDPLRAGDELNYYPGEINFRRADVLVINKMDSASPEQIELLMQNIKEFNPDAKLILADSLLASDEEFKLKGKTVLAIEDGPTTTHGNVKTGAASEFAKRNGAKLVCPKAFAVGELKATFEKYPNIGCLLPAMGYSKQQIKDLQATINKVPCDAVVSGTPIDITKLVDIKKKLINVTYELKERPGSLTLKQVLEEFLKNHKNSPKAL